MAPPAGDGRAPEGLVEYVPGRLEAVLTARRDAGHKLLVPYVTGGMDDDWLLTVEALAGAGADAIEVGIPFSDPMIDGPTIQEASLRALERGTTPDGILADLSRIDVGVPVVVMTYYNLIYRAGHDRIAGLMAESGVSGAIIPDLPLEELGPWARAADHADVATVLLVAPSTPAGRIAAVCRRSRGFVYAVGRMGVTGEQAELADRPGRWPNGWWRPPNCRSASGSASPLPPRPWRCARWPTAWSSGRPWCAACWKAGVRTPPPPSCRRSAGRWTGWRPADRPVPLGDGVPRDGQWCSGRTSR